MKEVVIDLEEQFQRPVTKIDGMTALIDTGALIPVVSMSEEDIKEFFNAKVVLESATIRGFGGECEGKIYSLDKLVLGELVYPNIHVFVPNEAMDNFDIIISSSMFYNLSLSINFETKRMIISIPDKEQCVRNLIIADKDGKLHVLFDNEK